MFFSAGPADGLDSFHLELFKFPKLCERFLWTPTHCNMLHSDSLFMMECSTVDAKDLISLQDFLKHWTSALRQHSLKTLAKSISKAYGAGEGFIVDLSFFWYIAIMYILY